MLKKPLIACVLCLSSLLFVGYATAQVGATLVLKSGERVSGDLIDLNASGFEMRVNGQDRKYGQNDVAVVEFTGGDASVETLARLRSGQPMVTLRSGQTIEGRLEDVGGTNPLRLTIGTSSGSRDYTSNDVARIYLSTPPGQAAVGTAGADQASAIPEGAIRVDANVPWTDTGIIVQRGERISFNASGDIMVAPGASAGVAGTPALSSTRYPVAGASAGALIGKIGNSAPFAIGSNTGPITMPAGGQLMIGINDDFFGDNTGSFAVRMTREPRRGVFGR
jgi:hypothetical protein